MMNCPQNPAAIRIGGERKHSREIAVVSIGDACAWNSKASRSAYDLVIKSWIDAGLEPHRLAAAAPGVGRKYGAFKQKCRFVERANFEDVWDIGVVRLQEQCSSEMSDWEMEAHLNLTLGIFTVGFVPSLVPAASSVIRANAERLLMLSGCRYGYVLRQQMLFRPLPYAYGLTVHIDDDWRPDDLRYNIRHWHPVTNRIEPMINAGILRNIFPENYLSKPHLSARLGHSSTTLEEWLAADPACRGTLETFSDILTKWTPPVEKIPQIREELYRAGRVFYWRWVNAARQPDGTFSSSHPLFRPDLSAPWVAPDPIPEIYRADYWKDKDPGLTY